MDTNNKKTIEEWDVQWFGGNSTVAFNNMQNLKYLESEEFNQKAKVMFEKSLEEDHVDYRPHSFTRSSLRTPEARVITENTPDR
ncbi:hypothetical protein D3C87_327630 [compost metagenome]